MPAPMSHPAQAPPRPAPAPRAASAAAADDAPRTATKESVPAELRKTDISNASAEDIARMLGSKAAVIPPAGSEPESPVDQAPAPKAGSNGAHVVATAGGMIDLETFIDEKLRPLAKQKSMKLDALLNGSCHAISYEGGVLTLGFYQDAHHKKSVESTQFRKSYEELASQILGEPVTIRCILAQKPPRPIRSKLVAHAVKNHGATIVTGNEER